MSNDNHSALAQACIVAETGKKIASMKVESAAEMIARALRENGRVELAVIETGRMSPAICHRLRALGIPVDCHGRRIGA